MDRREAMLRELNLYPQWVRKISLHRLRQNSRCRSLNSLFRLLSLRQCPRPHLWHGLRS